MKEERGGKRTECATVHILSIYLSRMCEAIQSCAKVIKIGSRTQEKTSFTSRPSSIGIISLSANYYTLEWLVGWGAEGVELRVACSAAPADP